jgi:hypothetical protein
MKTIAALVVVAALASNLKAPVSTTKVEVKGPRVHTKDIFPGNIVDLDLGPTPPIGASRLIEKSEIEKAFADAKATPPKQIPAQVRVSRKTRKLSSLEVDTAIKTALPKLPRGGELLKVRATATEVADDYDHVSVELPPVPRRAGPTTLQATITFVSAENETPIYRTIVPLDIALPPEAAFAEIPKGAPIQLVVKKGLIEVSVPGNAAVDADVGAIVPVSLKPSGRIIRARAIDKDHAVAVEQ